MARSARASSTTRTVRSPSSADDKQGSGGVRQQDGATADIGGAIAAELRTAGHQVDVRAISDVDTIDKYDAVIVGSAIYLRRWRREAVRFLRRHEAELRDRQIWLFHSGPVGPDTGEIQTMPRNVARTASRIGAEPAVTFPGRLDPASAKGFLARRLATGELAADSRDWHRIADWAHDISTALAGRSDR